MITHDEKCQYCKETEIPTLVSLCEGCREVLQNALAHARDHELDFVRFREQQGT